MKINANEDHIQRIVAVSNQVAEYPPLDLTKAQYQALLVLISCIDSTVKPVYGIDDIVEEIKARGITDHREQMLFLEEIITQQNTYRIPYKEYLRYFTGGETPQGGVIQRAMEAVLSLNNKNFRFSNPDYEGSYAWFQAVALEKATNDLVFVITSFAKPFLMGLRREFLQMLAESTIEFDGKYSVPIFLYMKSRLFDGRAEYHGKESLEIFKHRFGLDGIKTYERFFDFQRRILDVAEKDSLKSGDIRFVFTGVPELGSKKITEIQYSIYRIGEIKAMRQARKSAAVALSEGIKTDNKLPRLINSEPSAHQAKLAKLSPSETRAYQFLETQGVNRGFIVDKILVHPNFKLEILRGYEDVYIETIWRWFLKKTKSAEKAAAFVSWWKNGRLTRTEVHWQAAESVQHKVKLAAQKQPIAPLVLNLTQKESPVEPSKTVVEAPKISKIHAIGRRGDKFDLEKFREDHPSVWAQISTERTTAFHEYRDLPNYKQLLQSSIVAHAESWWKEQGN